jgi:hypothetical protein
MLFKRRTTKSDKFRSDYDVILILKQDSYILFKNQEISDDLVDIEVCMTNHNQIRSKLILDKK